MWQILWPHYAVKVLPLHTAGEAFQQAAAAATAFEDEAARSGWVPGVGCGARNARGGRIHSYVKHALNRFLHAKRLRFACCTPPCSFMHFTPHNCQIHVAAQREVPHNVLPAQFIWRFHMPVAAFMPSLYHCYISFDVADFQGFAVEVCIDRCVSYCLLFIY